MNWLKRLEVVNHKYHCAILLDFVVVVILCVCKSDLAILFIVLGAMFVIALFSTKHIIEEAEKLRRKGE